MHHTHMAALVAALQEAVAFVENTYGDANLNLANRVTQPWRAALSAASLTPGADLADASSTPPDDRMEAIRFHLNRAVDAAGEVLGHAFSISCLALETDPGDVQDSVHALALSAPVDAGPSALSDDQVAVALASWQATARRRRRAKRLLHGGTHEL